MQEIELQGGVENLGLHDILVDLLNSLSAVKALSEIDSQRETDEKGLMLDALSALIDNQDMERCSFFIKSENDELINLTGVSTDEVSNHAHTQHRPLVFKFGEGLIGKAAEEEEIQHCTDCYTDERISGQHSEEMPRSIISVPVKVSGELFGVLNVSHPDANYFSDWHLRLLGAVAVSSSAVEIQR